jgi:hypothetical protein
VGMLLAAVAAFDTQIWGQRSMIGLLLIAVMTLDDTRI